MQPEWRSDSDGMLIQDTPPGEDWVAVNKGGSAGMYFVVVSLSWWVMAEGTGANNSLNVWSAVADISWWFQEMRNRALMPNSRGKRGHEEEEEDSQPKKSEFLTWIALLSSLIEFYYQTLLDILLSL